MYVHFPFHPFHSSYHRDARYLEPFSCSHITFSSSRTVFLVTVAVTCIVQRCNVAHGFPSRTISSFLQTVAVTRNVQRCNVAHGFPSNHFPHIMPQLDFLAVIHIAQLECALAKNIMNSVGAVPLKFHL